MKDHRGKPIKATIGVLGLDRRLELDSKVRALLEKQEANVPFVSGIALEAARNLIPLVLALAITAIVIAVPDLRRLWLARPTVSCIVLAVVVLIPYSMLTLPRARYRAHRRRILLHEGLCAGCAYSLRSLVAESDGCTVCPECGSAWRLGKGVSVAEFGRRGGPGETR